MTRHAGAKKRKVLRLRSSLFFLLFQIILKDDGEGEVQLKAHRTLNCEKRKNYKFDIAAVSCSGEVSEK